LAETCPHIDLGRGGVRVVDETPIENFISGRVSKPSQEENGREGNIKMFPTNNIFPNRMQKGKKKKVKFVENSNVLPLVERNVSE